MQSLADGTQALMSNNATTTLETSSGNMLWKVLKVGAASPVGGLVRHDHA